VLPSDVRPPLPRPDGDDIGDMRALLAGTKSAGRGDRLFRALAVGAGLLVLLILGGIAFTTTREAWPAFARMGVRFFLGTTWNPAAGEFGAAALIYGTLLVSFIAIVLAVPLSVGIALFSTEMAGRRLKGPLSMGMDLLAAIPSVIYGLWAVMALGAFLEPRYASIAESVGRWPVFEWFFSAPVRGTSILTTGIVLAVMIIPIITSLSREVILTVPSAQREAALALGATRWEMIRGAVFPWSRSGITGAVMLGLGRAMGETIAVALIIGNSANITTQLFGPADTMASIIAMQWGESGGVHRSALIGLGAALFLITIAINLMAQKFISRFDVESS
jgi:phosphate transport system permease protein